MSEILQETAISYSDREMLPPTHPGTYIYDYIMEPYNLTQTELAEALGVTRLTVNRLLRERQGISVEMALRLERFLAAVPREDGTSTVKAETWLKLQWQYDLYKARAEEELMESLEEIATATHSVMERKSG